MAAGKVQTQDDCIKTSDKVPLISLLIHDRGDTGQSRGASTLLKHFVKVKVNPLYRTVLSGSGRTGKDDESSGLLGPSGEVST